MYQPLNRQQAYVLGEVYAALTRLSCQIKPEEILGRAHQCCTYCQHLLIRGKARLRFEADLDKAREELNGFERIFASWNDDRSVVSLFGAKNAGRELVLLGEYGLSGGIVPSYSERLDNLRTRYRAFWPARLAIAAMLASGISLLMMPIFYALVRHTHNYSPFAIFYGQWFLVIGGILGWRSLRKYLLLRQPAIEPNP